MKIFGYDGNLRPPFLNYKYVHILNPVSMNYLKFLDKYILPVFFKKKIHKYELAKNLQIETIKEFYALKNKYLDEEYNLDLKKFGYY